MGVVVPDAEVLLGAVVKLAVLRVGWLRNVLAPTVVSDLE